MNFATAAVVFTFFLSFQAFASQSALNKIFSRNMQSGQTETNLVNEYRSISTLFHRATVDRCFSCHSDSSGEGWTAYKMPESNVKFWESSFIGFLRPQNTNASSNSVSINQLYLYRLLSNDSKTESSNLRMPPMDVDQIIITNKDVLDKIAQNHGQKWFQNSEAKKQTEIALGTQPIYVATLANGEEVCFDEYLSGANTGIPSLCNAFNSLKTFINGPFKSRAEALLGSVASKKSLSERWTMLTRRAESMNHYDPSEGMIPGESVANNQSIPFGVHVNKTVDATSKVIYRLSHNQSINYYTRVAPDNSYIGFSIHNPNPPIRYFPYAVSLTNKQETPIKLNFSYDPTFSMDFSFKDKTGFLFGASGVQGSNTAKTYTFYSATNGMQSPIGALSYNNISGYGTLAKITDLNVVPAVWHQFKDNYILMGKRWHWVALRLVKKNGRDSIEVMPNGQASSDMAHPPICESIKNLNGSFDSSDMMLSPNGEWIALRANPSKTPILVRSKDCTVVSEHSDKLLNLYGGKVAFSLDSRYMAFHAYGADGKKYWGSENATNEFIKSRANEGWIANIFVYDIQTKRLAQLTHYSESNSGLAMFPNFDGNSGKLYYHRHMRGDDASELVVIENPLDALK